MATFKSIILAAAVVLALSECSRPAKQTTVTTRTPFPQMSVEDGRIIKEREISIWEFSKTKQLDKLREILADDYIGYFVGGIMHPSDVLTQLRNTQFNNYHLSNIEVKPASNDVAIIYYDVTQDIVSADGTAWVPQIKASSVYAKRNGVWYSVFYQEMPVR